MFTIRKLQQHMRQRKQQYNQVKMYTFISPHFVCYISVSAFFYSLFDVLGGIFMKLGRLEICYIPYNKSQYQIAKEELAKVELSELKNIMIGASLIMATTVNTIYAKINVANFTEKIDAEGYRILGLLHAVGYWAAIVFAGIELIKNLKKQDISGAISTVLKYFVAVALLYGLSDIFDLARSLFH